MQTLKADHVLRVSNRSPIIIRIPALATQLAAMRSGYEAEAFRFWSVPDDLLLTYHDKDLETEFLAKMTDEAKTRAYLLALVSDGIVAASAETAIMALDVSLIRFIGDATTRLCVETSDLYGRTVVRPGCWKQKAYAA
jgi:hypothetical protein